MMRSIQPAHDPLTVSGREPCTPVVRRTARQLEAAGGVVKWLPCRCARSAPHRVDPESPVGHVVWVCQECENRKGWL